MRSLLIASIAILLLIATISVPTNGNEISDVIEILSESAAVIKALEALLQFIDIEKYTNIHVPVVESTKKLTRNVLSNLTQIARQLDDLTYDVETQGSVIYSLEANILDNQRYEFKENDLVDYLTRIEVIFERMQDYLENIKELEKETLEDFARNVVSHNAGSVNSLLDRIHAILIPPYRVLTNNGLLMNLHKLLAVRFLANKIILPLKTSN